MSRALLRSRCHLLTARAKTRHSSTDAIVCIQNATFYKSRPSIEDSETNEAILKDVTFELSSNGHSSAYEEFWAVISPSSVSRTSFLHILGGQYIAVPPRSRKYPYLSAKALSPHDAIKYVGFDADRGDNVSGTSVRGAYLSARYESRREETDFSVRDYLLGNTHLNALAKEQDARGLTDLAHVTSQLNLSPLLDMPVSNLSNGQTRRARIAKALMSRPELLLLDGPFMGLDPSTVLKISDVLKHVAHARKPRLVISLRPEDKIPQWINRLIVIDERRNILAQNSKDAVLDDTRSELSSIVNHTDASAQTQQLSRDGFPKNSPALEPGEALIEMQGVKVSYGDRTVLGAWQQVHNNESRSGLWWSLHRGQRCGIFGPNGSGKTTMLSLITSDHPQTYGLPIKLFGRSRVPERGELGISLFDLQKSMGHSSPEVHAFFPKQLTVRRTLESAWADAPLARASLDDAARKRVDAFLKWFEPELRAGAARRDRYSQASPEVDADDWASQIRFSDLSFTSQRLALFLRAIIASPDLVILDEAFSGMDEPVRDKALLFLSQGQKLAAVTKGVAVEETASEQVFSGLTPHQALLVISHAKEDVPGCVRDWICLPEPGEGRAPRTGTLDGPLELHSEGWSQIWANV